MRADRRRLLWIAAALAAAVVVVVAAAAWGWRRTDPRTAATGSALDRVAALGAPAGWAPAEPTTIVGVAPEHGRRDRRHGLDLRIDGDGSGAETGFEVSWTTTATPASSRATCEALLDWALRLVPYEDPGQARESCRATVAHPAHSPGLRIFTSQGTPPSAAGRYLFAAAGSPQAGQAVDLVATVTYEADDPGTRTG